MKLEELKKEITEMDVKSEEFFEIVMMVIDRYYTFDKPDNFQKSLSLIQQWMSKDVPDKEYHVQIIATLVQELFVMKSKNQTSCTGTLGFKDATFFFDIYTTENEKDKMSELLIKAHDSMEKGNYTLKDKFGKKYFPKK